MFFRLFLLPDFSPLDRQIEKFRELLDSYERSASAAGAASQVEKPN
jgi:hypothetical protein